MFLSKGILKYFPIEGAKHNQGWLILQCEPDISLYYCWFVQKKLGVKLQEPLHGCHVSIVRVEVIKYLEKWNAYQGHTLDFHYSNKRGVLFLTFDF